MNRIDFLTALFNAITALKTDVKPPVVIPTPLISGKEEATDMGSYYEVQPGKMRYELTPIDQLFKDFLLLFLELFPGNEGDYLNVFPFEYEGELYVFTYTLGEDKIFVYREDFVFNVDMIRIFVKQLL